MLKRALAISLVFISSVALTVSLFYAPTPVSVAAALLLTLAVLTAQRLTRPSRIPRACCLSCGYDLTGLEPIGLCPECAEPYTERPPLEAILRERLEARNQPRDPARDDPG